MTEYNKRVSNLLTSINHTFGLRRLKVSELLLLLCAVLFLTSSTLTIYKLYLRERNNELLRKQLSSNLFSLSNLKGQIKSAQIQREEAAANAERAKNEMLNYFNSVPLVVATLNGKGRLVGFSRLLDNGGQAQYSFQLIHEGESVNVSGIVTNQNGKLAYADDYNTNYDLRTTGEITHSKNKGRLHLVFVVTSTNSKNYQIGDTFTASFVLPSEGVES